MVAQFLFTGCSTVNMTGGGAGVGHISACRGGRRGMRSCERAPPPHPLDGRVKKNGTCHAPPTRHAVPKMSMIVTSLMIRHVKNGTYHAPPTRHAAPKMSMIGSVVGHSLQYSLSSESPQGAVVV